MTALIPLNTHTILGHNQEAYQQLRLAAKVNLRRQLLIAVCDDADLQRQLAERLVADFAPTGPDNPSELSSAESLPAEAFPPESLPIAEIDPLVSIWLDGQHPDPVREILQWIQKYILARADERFIPTFQILGINQLTRQSPTVQNRFLASLNRIETILARLNLRLILWVSRPWLRKICQVVPKVWQLRNGVFEFAGDPTPPTLERLPSQPVARAVPPTPPIQPAQFWTILTEDLADLEARNQPKPVPLPPRDDAHPPPPLPPATVQSAPPATVSQPITLAQPVTPASPPPPPGPPSAPNADLALPTGYPEDLELHGLWEQIQNLQHRQAGPLTLARAYLVLGQVCRDRIEAGDTRPDLVALAIASYTHALPGLTPGTTDWCDGLNDLGSLYWLRSQSETTPAGMAHWLHHSLQVYQMVLDQPHGACPPEALARIYSNQATVYSLLANWEAPATPPSGNLSQHGGYLEQAVRAYHRALQYRPAESFPAEYAALQNSLGAIHWRLAQQGEPRHHLHRAIAAYREALPYRSPTTLPQEYAMLQNNLGIAYWSLAQHERPVFLLEQAIQAYQSALAYRTLTTDPAGCAATYNNLGTAYWDLAQQAASDPDRQLAIWEQAVAAYEYALEAAHRVMELALATPLTFDVWATFHSAGVVHDQLAQHLPETQAARRTEHLERALSHYLTALEGWQNDPQRSQLIQVALMHNIRLQFQIRGLEGQNAALSRIPGQMLAAILPRL